MCVKQHWQEANHTLSHTAAQKFALQLGEYARNNGYDPRGIKVRDRRHIIKQGFGKAEAQVVWHEGPTDWVENITIISDDGICCMPENRYTLSFYQR